MDLESVWPPFALRIRAGDMELSPVRESDYPELAGIAAGGVRRDNVQSFLVNWDTGTAEEVARSIAQYQWGTRARFHVDDWTIEFTVRVGGRAVGVQGVSALGFTRTRSVTTGSWLAWHEQGRGYGTRMRSAVVAAFADHFDTEVFHSAHFEGNDSSRRVSEKLGYSPNGVKTILGADGQARAEHQLVLAAEDLDRAADTFKVDVTGAEAVRRFLGLTST